MLKLHLLATPRQNVSPHHPWPKQQAFLNLPCLEAFYGGAAGGGKSDALLMAALQYVHVPGYAALILRRDTQRLSLAGGLIPRAAQWLAGSQARWNAVKRTWTFPTIGKAASLTFGYLQDPTDKFRYASSEFQYIAFDELTEFSEEDYLFLFSRLRRTQDLRVPLRVRSASNPGNMGHQWVKERFISPAALAAGREMLGADDATGPSPSVATTQPEIFYHHQRAYLPARLGDNPALDAAAYRTSLAHLPALARERLLHGDWSIQERGLVRAEWLRYFSQSEGQLQMVDGRNRLVAAVSQGKTRRFVTIDPAGTSRERAAERRGRPASWTVTQVWDQPLGDWSRLLLLRHQMRVQVGFDGLCKALREVHAQWRPARMWIENEKLGQAAVDVLGRELPLVCIATRGQDKLARAAPLINKLEAGEIYLPREPSPWRAQFEAELLSWTGDPLEPADQIDAAAYAAQLSLDSAPNIIRLEPVIVR